MELKELHHIINTHLKDNSLAEARFVEDVFQDSVIVEHPTKSDAGSIITITKNFECWELEYQKHTDGEIVIEMKINSNDNREDINEIITFINNHTMQDTPQIVTNLC